MWGPEKGILSLCGLLPLYGFSCEIGIVYRREDGPEQHPMVHLASAQSIPVSQLNGYLADIPETVRQLRRKVERESFSIIHSHEYKTNLIAALATVGMKRRPALVATVRHTEPGFQMALFQTLDSVVLHRFDRLTIPSRGSLLELKYWPALRHKTTVIHHTLEPMPAVKCDPPTRDRGPVISIVGRLQSVKGHRVFLDSARIVFARNPQARFWIVGSGELRAKLESTSKSLGLEGVVSFLGYREDACALMSASDIVVCASSYEAFSRSVLEALALGRPVVATAVGGIPEIVRHEETGLLVPTDDPHAMAAAIVRLLDDVALAGRLGGAGRRLVSELYTLEAQAAALATLYRGVLDCV